MQPQHFNVLCMNPDGLFYRKGGGKADDVSCPARSRAAAAVDVRSRSEGDANNDMVRCCSAAEE